MVFIVLASVAAGTTIISNPWDSKHRKMLYLIPKSMATTEYFFPLYFQIFLSKEISLESKKTGFPLRHSYVT